VQPDVSKDASHRFFGKSCDQVECTVSKAPRLVAARSYDAVLLVARHDTRSCNSHLLCA